MLKSLARTWIRTSVLRKGLSGDSKFWAFVGVVASAFFKTEVKRSVKEGDSFQVGPYSLQYLGLYH